MKRTPTDWMSTLGPSSGPILRGPADPSNRSNGVDAEIAVMRTPPVLAEH
jgi:hypothetical protein